MRKDWRMCRVKIFDRDRLEDLGYEIFGEFARKEIRLGSPTGVITVMVDCGGVEIEVSRQNFCFDLGVILDEIRVLIDGGILESRGILCV